MVEEYENTFVTVLKCGNGEISFPACELYAKALQIKILLQKYFQMEGNSPEACLEKINARPLSNSLATIKGNLELVNKAVERIAAITPLEKGERVFCFCCRDMYGSVYETSNLLDNGYLVTNKRLLFCQDTEISVLPVDEIHSLTVNPISEEWYLNGAKMFSICWENLEPEEAALILWLIFLLAKEESKRKTAPESRSFGQHPTELSLTDRLREAKNLYDGGLINEAEYSGLREKILEKFV